jgi:SAM-dependent methyltransferase
MSEADEVRRSFASQSVRWQDVRYRSWMPGNLFIQQEAERVWIDLLRRNGLLPLGDRKILDVGCGSGKTLLRFLLLGARPENTAGIDLLEAEIEQARALSPLADFRVADATELPFESGTFDLALAFTAFSSMRSAAMRQRAAAEITRVLAPSGALLWYDFWINPRNPEVQPLRLKQIEQLFPGAAIEARRVTLLPPVARRVAPVSWLACGMLNALPFTRTHWLALIKPGVDSATR